uniref:Mating-type alpha1 protein n=1 Tax=Kluyveromyces marxianus TaxID=4911 RepID=F4NCP6_KLUMA|nr:mating-type alpha1 protein [Kluyveromyces marxianus]CCA89280.1 silenced copy of mating-type protein alpha1 at HML [Kluyveromyces marxianus]
MKSKAPTFKVTITKHNSTIKKSSKKKTTLSPKKIIQSSGYRKHEGVNLYMSKSYPTSIPDPPQSLISYLKKKLTNVDANEIVRTLLSSNELDSRPKKNKPKRQINDFIAFRSYYSRILNGLVSQTELSSIISKHWTVDKQTRKMWEIIAQEYNCEKTNNNFFEWLRNNYVINKDWLFEIIKFDDYMVVRSQKPYIENIYKTGHKQILDFSSEVKDLEENGNNQIDFFVDPIFLDYELSTENYDKFNLAFPDTQKLVNTI